MGDVAEVAITEAGDCVGRGVAPATLLVFDSLQVSSRGAASHDASTCFVSGGPARGLDADVILGALPPEDGPGRGAGEGGAVRLALHARATLVAPERITGSYCVV